MNKALIPLLATGLSSLAIPAYAGSDFVVTHHERLESFELARRAPVSMVQEKAAAESRLLSFDALGRRYDLELEPNDRLLSEAARRRLPPDVAVYRGKVAGLEASWVRLVVAGGVPSGVVWDGSEMLAIETPGDSAVESDVPVIYRLKDTYVTPGSMSCGTERGARSGAAAYTLLVDELKTGMAQAAAADLQLDLGVVGDFELFEHFGSSVAETEEAILTRLNVVDGIYSEQLGVQLRVEELHVFPTEADAFTDESDAETLLDEVAAYRRDTPAQSAQGLTHLYTGRDLDTTTVGIAYLDTLCHPLGVGLSEGWRGSLTAGLVAAHEIGHNFGAEHDAEEGSVCADTPAGFLMEASVNGSDMFSQCSIDTISPKIEGASCIAASPTVDMSISLDGDQGPVLLGAEVSLTFTASNAGGQSATNVVVEIGVPDNVTFESASTEFGTCTSGAGIVDCTYGTVPGNGERSVTVIATASAVGSGTFTATVSSDTDVDPDNNEESVTLVVEPAVDLVVNSVPVARTEVSQAVAVSFDLENRSTLGASGVALSVSLESGIRADSASWPLGACTVAERQVDCTADDFAAQSAAVLDLTLSGVTNGQSNYTVSLSAAEPDANETNNSINAAVQVGPVSMPGSSSSGGGGGGGATAPVSLLLLAAAAAGAAGRPRRRY